LNDLWTSTPFFGDNILRKIERRYILTSELLVKHVYGKLIGLGTKQVYDEALPTTAVVLENDSLQYLPRYDKFANAVMALAKQGHNFKEIAGNNSAILLSVLIPAIPSGNKIDLGDAQIVFTQPLSSDPTTDRIALAVPVESLSKLLLQLDHENVKVEHVFDF
jgi:hypothetical protein